MKKPYIIGIAGGSASGKSTFTRVLAEALSGLKVHTVHMDDYFKHSRPYTASHVSGVSYTDNNHPLSFDLPKMTDDLKTAIEKRDHDVIIVEGLLTLWSDNIFPMLDLKLFIDCRADERIVRRLKRNVEWGETFDEMVNVYLDMVRFRHDQYVEPSKWRADIILNGSIRSAAAVKMIAGYVKFTP